MLTTEEKIKLFEKHLTIKNDSYGDAMKSEIYYAFFEDEWNFKFLQFLNTEDEIKNKIDLVVSKMILHEHEEGFQNIMSYQFYG